MRALATAGHLTGAPLAERLVQQHCLLAVLRRHRSLSGSRGTGKAFQSSMSFITNALRVYRDRHLNTGSSKPLIQVCTYVGFGMYFVECAHHYLHTRDARAYTSVLEGKFDEAKAGLADHMKAIDSQAAAVTAASNQIQLSTAALRELEAQTPSFEAKIAEAQAVLDAHKKSLH